MADKDIKKRRLMEKVDVELLTHDEKVTEI
jgi:hypothetical protein